MIIRCAVKEDVDWITKIQIDLWNTTCADLIPEDYLNSHSYDIQREKWQKRFDEASETKEFILVAETENDDIVGFVSGRLCDRNNVLQSTLCSIYILKEYQNKGIGKRLMKAAAARLRQEGAKNMYLWALREDSACGFYEHLGGMMIEIRTTPIAGKELLEAAYFWRDIESLINF